MTPIKGFVKYLKGDAIFSLSKTEEALKKIDPEEKNPQKIRFEIARWQGLKLSLGHFLNTLYFEMLDFKIDLEREIKKTGSKAGKAFLKDLEKKMDFTLALREEVLATGTFTNRELFVLTQQKFLLKIRDLRNILQKYANDLQPFEQGLLMN